MPDTGPEEWIVATEDAKTLPVQELLTGRGFVSGKSGSGKSNTVSVICEELLEANFTLLIVDTEGEYFGLKEEYQLLHVGGDDFAEVQVGPEHADKIAEIALEKNVPVILDVSGYDDTDTSEELITRVIDELYTREKKLRKPFLLVVEEMQEYLPQQGGSGDLGELLERVAKRGRKRGLGMCGVSQRPSSVDKDYITQCDWMVWHKFTWESDLKVVGNVIGSERAKEVEDFSPGEAYLMTDWDDSLERVQFRQKRTFDAGATPGLESYDQPNLKQVGEQFVSEIQGDAGGTGVSDEQFGNADGSVDGVEENGESSRDGDGLEQFESGDPSSQEATSRPSSDELALWDDALDLDDDEIEELDASEIAERYKRVKKENFVLKDEISELRDITAESEDSDESRFRAESQSFAESDSDARMRRFSTAGGDSNQRSRNPDPPTRPLPPKEQDVDDGITRAFFEFGELVIYLTRLFFYYAKYSLYKTRLIFRQDEQSSTRQRDSRLE